MTTELQNKRDIKDLQLISAEVRKQIMKIILTGKAGHTGGSLSSADILVSLFFDIMNHDPNNPQWAQRDRFVMSKGHSVEAYYCVLAEAGYFSKDILNTYGEFKSILAGHPTVKVPGIELNSGALGHGLSVGVGMAIAAKKSKSDYQTYVLMGDGEQGEGSIYEAAMSGSHYQLDNLTAIIDRNKLQISGDTECVMKIDPIAKRWEALGWHVVETDGNDIASLRTTFINLKKEKNRPHLVIAHTVKGKGVSYIENNHKWHHKVPSQEEYDVALKELDHLINNINNER
jgi:transketolase